MTRKRSWHSGKARLGPARVPRALAAGFLLALCAVLSAPPAQAVDAVVTWEADANPDLAGFRLHYGQASGSYQASVDVGAATTWTLAGLEDANRIADQPEGSYTARLFAQGPSRIAQKLGEEGVETALAAVSRDDEGLVSECADLVFHLLVLLKSRDLTLERVVDELRARHASKA